MHRLYNKITAFCFVLLSTLLFSCADLIIPELKVENISHDDKCITIRFSNTINQNLAIEAFTLKRDSENQNGTFSFNDSEMIFTPNNKIQEGFHYIVTITTQAEDIYGSSLMLPYVYNFSTKGENGTPEIQSITPEDETVFETAVTQIQITFTKAIKKESFQNSFSLKPSVTYKTDWSQDQKSVTVTFDKPLENSTRYTVTISKSLQDTDNNFLANQFTSIFTNNQNLETPLYTLYSKTDTESVELLSTDILSVNENLRTDSYLYLDFSKEIEVDKFSSYFSIKPSLSYSIEPDYHTNKAIKITFSNKAEWDKEQYLITIKKGITDTFSNPTSETKQFNIRFNNSKDKPPVFVKGFFDLKESDYYVISKDTEYTNMKFKVEEFQEGTDIETDLYIFFEISPDADSISLNSAMRSVKFSTTNGCVSITQVKMEKISSSDFSSLPFYSQSGFSEIKSLVNENKNITGIKIHTVVDNAEVNGQVIFSISTDLEDNLSNKLKEKLSLSFNKS